MLLFISDFANAVFDVVFAVVSHDVLGVDVFYTWVFTNVVRCFR